MQVGKVWETGVMLKIHEYNIEDVLVQMIDDYGEEELIKKIKALK